MTPSLFVSYVVNRPRGKSKRKAPTPCESSPRMFIQLHRRSSNTSRFTRCVFFVFCTMGGDPSLGAQGTPWEGTLGSPRDPMGGDPWEPKGSHGRGPLGAQGIQWELWEPKGPHGRGPWGAQGIPWKGTLGSPRDPMGGEPLGAQGIPWEGTLGSPGTTEAQFEASWGLQEQFWRYSVLK